MLPYSLIQTAYRLLTRPLPAHPVTFQLIRHYCVGEGLEIGPGRHPYCVGPGVVYLEKHPGSRDGMARPHIVADANAIPRPDESFDYLLSSHVLEHMPDTIRTLNEWARVLKPDGVLVLILPHADRTFDRHRQKTRLDHHIRDHVTLGAGPDHGHDAEAKDGWEKLEDLDAIATAHHAVFGDGTMWDFDHRIAHDAMHYHVWTQDEIVRLLQHLSFQIVAVAEEVADRGDSFIVVARSPYTS